MRKVRMAFEGMRSAGVIADVDGQAAWRAREVAVGCGRLVIELKPVRIKAFDDAMLNPVLASEYQDMMITRELSPEYAPPEDWDYVGQFFESLTPLTRLYLVGEEETICLTFKDIDEGSDLACPVRIFLPGHEEAAQGRDVPADGWRVEWEEGRKQSVLVLDRFCTEDAVFDFLQQVKRERRRIGNDAVIRVAPSLSAAETLSPERQRAQVVSAVKRPRRKHNKLRPADRRAVADNWRNYHAVHAECTYHDYYSERSGWLKGKGVTSSEHVRAVVDTVRNSGVYAAKKNGSLTA